MHISPLKLGLLIPVGLYLLWLLLGLVPGRRPSSRSLKTGLSLLLLFYFLAVTGTGIFWVATQHLPPFDLHYLVGTIFLALGLAHVALSWRTVAAFLRGKAPSAVKDPGGRSFRSWVRVLGLLLLVLGCGAAVFLAGGRYASERYVIQVTESTTATTRRLALDGEEMSLARFYHHKTAFPLLSSIRLLFKEIKPLPPYKAYPGKAVIPLPANRPAGRGGSVLEAMESWRSFAGRLAAGSSMSLESLALVLFHAQGLTQKAVPGGITVEHRTAPSADAIYPVDVYVAVNRVRDLPAGLYHYNVKRHGLERLRSGTPVPGLEAAAESPHLYAAAAATMILSVRVSGGIPQGEGGYRMVHLDAGHVAANLLLSASAQGFRAPLIARFDDEALNAWLGFKPAGEVAALVIPVGRPAGDPTPPAGPRTCFTRQPFRSTETADLFAVIHRGTSLRRGEPPCAAGLRREAGDGATPVEEAPKVQARAKVKLPPPERGEGLYRAFLRRRSTRRYSGAPLSRRALSALCRAALGRRGNRFLSTAAPLRLYAAIRDVEGIPPGAYRCLPTEAGLERLRSGDLSGRLHRACMRQSMCATADVVFFMATGWRALSRPDGDRGYRYASLLAGIAGEGLYLQAAALGLGACGVGGFTEPEVASILGRDPAREAIFYGVVVGR